jgi:DNA-binding transcriptional LysR family regulator
MVDEVVAITSLEHPLGAKKYLVEKDFNGVDLINIEDESNFDFFKNHLLSKGISPRSMMTIKQPEAILELVSAGLGVSLFPMWAVKPYHQTKKISVSPLTKQGFKLEWKIAYLKKPKKPVFITEFIKHLVSESALWVKEGYYS